MKEYKRLTQSYKGAPLHTDMEVTDGDEIYERLAELEDRIENGTLIELPCEVGDKVYFPIDNGWDYAEVDQIHIFEKDIVFEWVQYDKGYELTELWDEGDFSIHDIGKTVFLTKAEAEKELKRLQNEREH